MLVKLCGFSEENSLKSAIEFGCNFAGFVFYDKSVRNVTIERAIEISKIIPSHIAKVAVVVDAKDEFLAEIAAGFRPDYIQFHGSETVQNILQFKKKFPQIKIIKAIKVSEKSDLLQIADFENLVDFFLFDSKVKNEMGGSGKSFDWNILKNLSTKKDWFLSGGLNINNLDDAIVKTNAKMVDISSAIEEKRGIKSPKLILALMQKIKNNYS
jgi:phosphoribosylanthranilate isomerase